MSPAGLGVVQLEPVRGWWPFNGYPPEIQSGGRVFRLTGWSFPYEGVAAQYREAVENGSAHLLVYANGSWVIDHLDEANPDAGMVSAIKHVFLDTPVGKAVVVTLLAGGALALGHGLARALDSNRA